MPKRYSRDDLVLAINEIRNGAKIRETERKYNIPHATMMDKLKEKSSLDARKGPSTVLTHNEEELLCLWLKAMAKKGIPVEPRQLVDAVEEIVKTDGRPSPFTEGRPGRKWVELFFKRHPDITLRKPEALGIGRSLVTEKAIKKWHGDLKQHVIEQTGNADLLKDPNRIINGDESGFQTNPLTSLVIGPKGFKDLYEVRGNNKECITVMVTFDAAGNMAPPCIVLPYERIPADISRNVNPNWSLGKSKSGWMTSPVFYCYVANCLIPFFKKKNTTFPVLFLIDGHKSHISYEVAKLCKDNDIILYSLLPNATHILQPADVSVFRPIKCRWRQIVSDWQKKTGNRTLTKANFALLIEGALEAATKEIMQKGFEKCGLFPFNTENIDYSKCLSHDSRIIDKPCDFKTEHLLFVESMISSSRIKEFRNSANEDWHGDESAKELFYTWKKIRNYILSQDKSKTSSLLQQTDIPQGHSIEIPEISHLEVPSCSNHNVVPQEDESNKNSNSVNVELPSTADNADLLHRSHSDLPLEHGRQSDDLPFEGNLDITVTSSNPDLATMLDFFHDEVNVLNSNSGTIQANLQFNNDHVADEENGQLKEDSVPKQNLPCTTPRPTSSKFTANAISPAFADCVLWPSESPVKKQGKIRKKLKLPDAVGAGAWVEYWENQKKIKLMKEENKRKRLERRKEREEEMKLKQIEKKAKQEQLKKKRTKKDHSSSSEEEEEENCLIDIKDHSDIDDIAELLEPRTPTPTEELKRDPLKDDYVLISFPVEGTNKETYYVGKVLSVKGSELKVSCLRRSRKFENKFVFPLVPDESTIDKDQVVYILKPTMLAGTKRQQSCVSFDIDLNKFNIN